MSREPDISRGQTMTKSDMTRLIEEAIQATIDAGLAVNGEYGVAAARHAARHILSAIEPSALSQPIEQTASVERQLADDILAELVRARTKFPGKNVTFAALVEEVGELATATFEESRDRVRKEAVQVAVMAMRMVLDGDHTFDDWRASKGLDALVLPASPLAQEAGR